MMSSRPDRSDAHLAPEEEARHTEETREYFDGIAAKRHTKPQRSEYSATYCDALPPGHAEGIPELDRFLGLEADSEKVACEGGESKEEFVETEYYKELGCIDKQHHTVYPIPILAGIPVLGLSLLDGFAITVMLQRVHNLEASIYVAMILPSFMNITCLLPLALEHPRHTGTGFIRMEKSNGSAAVATPAVAACDHHPSCGGNPATNEWIPSTDTDIIPASHKPNRSDA